jgi:NAD(P)-dependent dehydrogenase (short-subunit alcohol dehydrogenase family)
MGNTTPFSLDGKKVFITGASSGIGRSISIECSKLGANLIISGRDETRLKETYDCLIGTGHKFLVADLSSEKDLENLAGQIESLDGIVHSAGIIKRIPLKLISSKSFEEILKINLLAPALITSRLHKNKLIKNGASVVFISSVGSNLASLGNIMYMSTKGALNSFMKGIALELAENNIRANAIEPGMIKTNLTKTIPDEALEEDIKRYPLGRIGTPEDVAWAAIYLLSDSTRWMTGSIIKIDGGLSLR